MGLWMWRISWQKFWRLSAGERRTLLAAVAGLVLARLVMGCAGVGRTQRLAARLLRRRPARPVTVQDAMRLARLIDGAARVAGGRCLARALVLLWMLRWKGAEGVLRVGVRRHGEGLEAHAWVEYDGVVLEGAGRQAEPFIPFAANLAEAMGRIR
jgi:hypothetical protein